MKTVHSGTDTGTAAPCVCLSHKDHPPSPYVPRTLPPARTDSTSTGSQLGLSDFLPRNLESELRGLRVSGKEHCNLAALGWPRLARCLPEQKWMSADTKRRNTEKQRQYFMLRETDLLYKGRAESLFLAHHCYLKQAQSKEVDRCWFSELRERQRQREQLSGSSPCSAPGLDSRTSYSRSCPSILPINVLSCLSRSKADFCYLQPKSLTETPQDCLGALPPSSRSAALTLLCAQIRQAQCPHQPRHSPPQPPPPPPISNSLSAFPPGSDAPTQTQFPYVSGS